MSDHCADLVIHVNETLDEQSLRTLESEINEKIGVMAVGHNPHCPHLLRVDYDSEIIRPGEFMKPIHRRGLHAQLVGF